MWFWSHVYVTVVTISLGTIAIAEDENASAMQITHSAGIGVLETKQRKKEKKLRAMCQLTSDESRKHQEITWDRVRMDRLHSQAGSQQRQQLQLQQVLQAGILQVWDRQGRLVQSEQHHKQVAVVQQP